MFRCPSFSRRDAARALAVGWMLVALPAMTSGITQAMPQAKMQTVKRGATGEPYRQMLADAIAETFKDGRSLSAFQAGLLRVSRAPQPGEYAVCLQTIENGRIAYFAAFITAGEVDAIRRAVGVDRCWLETNYSGLPTARPPKPKKPWETQTTR
jgi:hypothetical protein